MNTRKAMDHINVRMPDDLIEELTAAAVSEKRTLRQLIRNVLRVELAERGLIQYDNRAPRLITTRKSVDG